MEANGTLSCWFVVKLTCSWISNSEQADTFVVFANVKPEDGYKGITAFVMSKDMGVQIVKKEAKVHTF